VVAAVKDVITEVKAAGKIVGVNAFVEAHARDYVEAGADYVNVGADVALLARGSEALADTWCPAPDPGPGQARGGVDLAAPAPRGSY
jgi:4-hydroxy-2-oxoheptanedioate aldolase